MIFDSHAHYDSHHFDEDRGAVLSDFLPKNGIVGVINCGSDLASSQFSLDLAEQYPYIYAACGVHPHEAEEAGVFDKKKLLPLLSHPKCVAVGEIGLDYHYDFSPRDIQKEWFEGQILLAGEVGLPIVVHDREAHAHTWELLKKYTPKGEVHCFSGSVEMARDVLNIGMYIGLGGAVTFKNAKTPVEVAKYVPLDRLLLETDCPYMTPVPFRGKRCDSTHIQLTAQRIAEIKGLPAETVLQAAYENGKKLFGIG
ncbi:MAG: TatD family hydrolase [Clostridia bacterium]|nr:TatD family hydrolase [Clostridia bacterium]